MDWKDIVSILVVLGVLGFIGFVIHLLTTFLFIGAASYVVYKLLFSDTKKLDK